MKKNARFPGWGSGQVTILLEYALSKGLSLKRILANSGITLDSLEHTDPSLEQELTVIRNLIGCIPRHPFRIGFDVGLNCNANSFGLMGQALLSFKSPLGLMEFAAQHLNGELNFTRIKPQISRHGVKTSFEVREDLCEQSASFVLGRDMGSSISFQESILHGIPEFVTEIGFKGSAQPGMELVGEYYQCPVQYEQSTNYILNDLRVMNVALPLGNLLLEKILSKRIENHLAQLPDFQSFEAKTRNYLRQVGYQDFSKEDLAKALNMSPRTFTRYLAKEGTNWRQLSTKLRMERAKECLLNSSETVEQIAFNVGFSSASSFSSAFSREIGRSPLEFRLTNAWSEEPAMM